MYLFSNNSKIKLYSLVKRKEDNYYICGRKNTEIYISTSEVGYEIIRLLEKEYKIGEVKNIIKKKYGLFNVDRFINYLMMQGYVEKIDKKILKEKIKKIKPILKFIDPKYVKWIFFRKMYFIYSLIFLMAFLILVFNTSYFPRINHYFLSARFLILVPVVFIVSWILVGFHELMHFLAAKSYKLPAEFGISNRLFYLVATSDITNIYALKREKRFRIILAGIFADITIFSLAIILMFLSDSNFIHISSFFYKLLRFVTLSEFLGILWQFLFFLRTDVYYAFENLVKVYNLNEKTDLFIKNEFFKLFNKNHHSTHFEDNREKNIVHFYTILFLVGFIVLLFNFFFYYLPITLDLILQALNNIYEGITGENYAIFYDAMIFVVFFLIHFALLVYGLIRHHRLYLRPRLYYLALFSLISSSYLIVFALILTTFIFLNKFSTFYLMISILAVLFGLFLTYLVRRLDRLAREELYTPE
ncbi:hypothetical protein HYX18_02550 [Candidatus Woesearchaeota archaeon]|nr:hypothetical protein [Candidatus Woesearchaeota archaeon]